MEWERGGKGRQPQSICLAGRQGTWKRPHRDGKSLKYKPDSAAGPKNLREVVILTQAGGRDLGVPIPAAPHAYARERKEQMCEMQGHLITPYRRPGWKQLCCRIPCCWPYRGRGRVLLLVIKAYQVVKLSRPVQLRSGGCCGRGQPGHQVQERAPPQHHTSETWAGVRAHEDAP